MIATTRQIIVSEGDLKPGKIRFVLENLTPRSSLELELFEIDSRGRGNAVGLTKPVDSFRNNRTGVEVTLSPGTYRIGIKGIAGPQSEIKVQP